MLLVIFLVGTFSSTIFGSTCNQCSNRVSQPSEVMAFCTEYNLTLTPNQRCCVNSTADNSTEANVVGVDLRNCSLQNVTGLFDNMVSLVVISLDDNPLSSVSVEDFYGLAELTSLYLPAKVHKCPGGSAVWAKTSLNASVMQCLNPVDTCLNKENNDTCPSPESYCAPAGPGLIDCLCSPGYHGYKCLRQGSFPLIPFASGISASTVVTAIFLWVTQRRFVKKHKP